MSATTDLRRTDADFAAALEAAKLEALYQFAYGLSHEINNPLANIATRAQTLLVDENDPERRRKLATINQQAFRAQDTFGRSADGSGYKDRQTPVDGRVITKPKYGSGRVLACSWKAYIQSHIARGSLFGTGPVRPG